MATTRPFSLARFAVVAGLVLFGATALWGYILSRGLWDGYFHGLFVVPLFFLVVGVVSVALMRRIMAEGERRLVVRFMYLTLGRLLLDILFVVGGLFLFPAHRIGFVAVTLICYILVLLLSIRAALKP